MKYAVFLFCLVSAQLGYAAQCMHEGKWYDYSSTFCTGGDISEKIKVEVGDRQEKLKQQKELDHRNIILSKTRVDINRDSESICSKKWTKRGVVNSRMYLYCIETQADGYKNLSDINRRLYGKSVYVKYFLPHCAKSWVRRGVLNANMMVYCLEQEMEGVRDYNYFRKKYTASVVDKIATRSLKKYGSWRMVSYDIKRFMD